MVSELSPALDRSLDRRFRTVADEARVQRTAAALEANGISVLRAADAADATRIVLGLIPDGSQVHHGASLSLEEVGHHRGDRDSPIATSRCARASGAWTARSRPTRSVA